MGAVCTGKSWSLRTLLPRWPAAEGGSLRPGAGKQVLVISLEPGFADTLGDCTCDLGLHVHYIPPLDVDWEDLMDLSQRVAAAADITKVTDPNKRNYKQFWDIYACCQSFQCDRCGEKFGPVDRLSDEFAVAMDGLTGLTNAATHHVVGLKPHKLWSEFDGIQQQIEQLLRKLVSMKASFVLVAHMDREPDPLGGYKLTMHTIGNKLAPRLTKDLFSEIVHTKRDDRGRFWWSTVEDNMDLKARRLPFSSQIPPSFTEILGTAANRKEDV